MRTSEQINELAAALAAAQKEVKNATCNTENPFFKSKYADLEAVKAASIPALNAHDIAVVQCPVVVDGKVGVVTRLVHKSGQWLEGDLLLPCQKQDAQSYGSAVSYARRYALAAFAGVATTDDDGNAATHATPPPAPVKAAKPKPPPIRIDPTPDDPKELGEVLVNFGTKYLNKPIKDVPLTTLEKMVAATLEGADQLWVQDCIGKYVRLAKEAAKGGA